MKTKNLVISIAIIIIVIIAIIGVYFMMNNHENAEGNIIKVTSTDKSMTGKLSVVEIQNVEQNKNGTYNLSNIITKYGGSNGVTNDLNIQNGEGELKLKNNTDIFMVANYVVNINPDYEYDSAPTVTVEYIHDGEIILTSSSVVSWGEAEVSFASASFYTVNGTKLTENDFVIDIPEFQEYLDSLNITF